MSDAEDKTKTGDRETKDSKDKSKEDGHLDNEVPVKTEDGKDDTGKSKDKVTPSKKNAKAKNQKKEEKNEVKDEDEEEDDEDDEDDEEDEEETETNGKVPLLDQPLQISGTRDRKKVQRFSEEFKAVIRESPKNEIPEGRGIQLAEIARIESLIQKHTSENLKPLYKVLFNRPGKLALVKRNIRKFNGFDFKEGSDEYSKKRASLIKLDMKSLKSISSTLALGSSGTREELVNNILNFLMEPKDSKKPPLKDSKKRKKAISSSSPSKKTKRKSNSTARRKKKAESDDEEESSEGEMEVDEKESSEDEKKQSSDEKNKSSDKKKASSDDKKESSDDKKDSSDEKKESSDEKKDSSDEEEDNSEDEKKKKKAPKKKPAANAKKPAPKKVEQKKVEATKKADAKTADKKKRKEKESEAKSDGESSEDEPLVKKTKMPPTDEEIKCFVKQILEGANLEEITMKTVCKQVYAAYPEFDLAHKKDFIKTTVKSLIST